MAQVKTDVIVISGWIIDGFVEYHPNRWSCSSTAPATFFQVTHPANPLAKPA
eukprot:COSAG02_NODE_62647_length_265_cov_0.765060_1_plen_51_part_01